LWIEAYIICVIIVTIVKPIVADKEIHKLKILNLYNEIVIIKGINTDIILTKLNKKKIEVFLQALKLFTELTSLENMLLKYMYKKVNGINRTAAYKYEKSLRTNVRISEIINNKPS